MDDTERHQQIALDALARSQMENQMQKRVSRENLDQKTEAWVNASSEIFQDFPVLLVKDLEKLTLGVYQLSLAKEYTKKHLNEDSEFTIQLNEEFPGVVRAKLDSRFKSAKKHQLWIEFDCNLEGHLAITGYYCDCWQGARTVGMCAHVTCVSILPNISHIKLYLLYVT